MNSEQIIQRLLENQQITASEALQLLKDIGNNTTYIPVTPNVPSIPGSLPYTFPHYPIVYCTTDTQNFKSTVTC